LKSVGLATSIVGRYNTFANYEKLKEG
jgi:hypothetical protein